jgi:hypothetical protein
MWLDEPYVKTERSGESGDSDLAVPRISLDKLMGRLFEAGLAVTACRSLAGGALAARLDSVIDILDRMIADIRSDTFEALGRVGSDKAVRAAQDPPTPNRLEVREASPEDALLAHLTEVSLSVERLWRLTVNNDHRGAAIALGDASQSLHRALIAFQASA